MRREPQAGLVSVVVPCYNAERFLAETLESVFAQTYRDIEIIAVDDGSTDRTADLIRSFGNRVRAEFGPNRGASEARNRGTELARGEFVQYLDSDDLLTPQAVETRVVALHEAGADVAYSDWERLVEVKPDVFETTEKVVRRIEDVHPNIQVALVTSFWAPPAAVTYRRTMVDKIGGWKKWLPVIQDARFLQDAGFAGAKFVYVPGIGARYRQHAGPSLSRSSAAAFMTDVFRNACDLQDVFQRRAAMNGDERLALAQVYDYAARSLFFQDKGAFNECVARLYEVEPGFRPTWPKTARLVSGLIGFKAASVVLSALTEIRSLARRSAGSLPQS